MPPSGAAIMNNKITAEAVVMFNRTSSRSMANLPATGGFQFVLSPMQWDEPASTAVCTTNLPVTTKRLAR
jgi:hypothetical protein